MARKFVGTVEQRVDGKGRVSIPATFRRVIEASDPDWQPGQRPTFSIAYGEDGRSFLEGFSVAGLAELHDKIDQLQDGCEEQIILEDLYYSRVQEFQIDEEGRIVLSQALRDRIGLTDAALFVAKGSRFEIWAPAAYHAQRASMTNEFVQSRGAGFNPRALLATAAKGQA